MRAAELDHGARTLDTQRRLERSRLVVDAGMDDSAVVAALVSADAIFFFENEQPKAGKAPRDIKCDGEADNASAYYQHVAARIGHG